MRLAAALVAVAALALAPAPFAQEPGFFTSSAGTEWRASEAELDQMLAPIALYPDALLSQVLVASTYPLEVVALQRWLDAHPELAGEALDRALEARALVRWILSGRD